MWYLYPLYRASNVFQRVSIPTWSEIMCEWKVRVNVPLHTAQSEVTYECKTENKGVSGENIVSARKLFCSVYSRNMGHYAT